MTNKQPKELGPDGLRKCQLVVPNRSRDPDPFVMIHENHRMM
jgi:hypothetical protein